MMVQNIDSTQVEQLKLKVTNLFIELAKDGYDYLYVLEILRKNHYSASIANKYMWDISVPRVLGKYFVEVYNICTEISEYYSDIELNPYSMN